jgi:hypothetical protein
VAANVNNGQNVSHVTGHYIFIFGHSQFRERAVNALGEYLHLQRLIPSPLDILTSFSFSEYKLAFKDGASSDEKVFNSWWCRDLS